MFKKGNNIFSLLVIILSIFMTSTSNVVNADSTSLGASTPQTTATTSKDLGTTDTEDTKGTADAENITNTASTSTKNTTSTDSSTSLSNQSSTTDWGNQLITKAQLQDENGTPQDSFGQYDTIKAYWEFSTNNHVVHDGDTMHVTVPKELTIANDILTPQPVTEIPGGKEIGTATLIKSTRTITVTFNQYAANKSKTSTVVGSFNAITHWDLGQVSVNQKVPLNWNLQGSATNDTDYTPSATVSKPSVTDPDEKLFKYGSYIDDTIQWTVRLNYASQEISDAVYKDTLGKNQELLIDSSNPFTVNSATADHATGKITNDTDNLFAETQPSDITNTGFTVDLGTINKPVIITYYTRITNYKNISSSYGNTGDLLSNKNEVQNLPVNISSTTLGSDASSGDQITSFMGHKIWKNVPADQIPKSITVNLIQNDNTTYASQKVTADSDWSYVFNNLPKYDDNGNLYKYTVTEDPVNGFTSSTSGNDLINVLTSSKTKFTVTKKWNDGKSQDDHDPITVRVYDGNGSAPKNYKHDSSVELSSKNQWTHTFTDLDPNITWFVSEYDIPAGYISEDSYPTDVKNDKVVTNTLALLLKLLKNG
ncbi:Cna B-type domain-containing protein [Companilactobacillus paralimentarius]|uniref:Cna B-type domain-containing protein n=1 Tax=Companilactobacillus paralimentarius TaxID=83526 RepID=UPI000468923E|nr:Cna B-type domain-containing protein [Companilactobacillus paralimentarius]